MSFTCLIVFGNEESHLSYEGVRPFGIIVTYLTINECDKKHTPPFQNVVPLKSIDAFKGLNYGYKFMQIPIVNTSSFVNEPHMFRGFVFASSHLSTYVFIDVRGFFWN